jgi:hypothetical protein
VIDVDPYTSAGFGSNKERISGARRRGADKPFSEVIVKLALNDAKFRRR